MSEIWYLKFSKQNSVFIAPDVHMHTSLKLYTMSIQPVNKVGEHIWSIQHRYWKGKKKNKREKRKKAVSAYLIKNNGGGGGGGHYHKQSERLGEYYVTVHPM